MGRPTKLTADRQARLLKFIEAGNYASVACRAAGISDDTLNNWKRRGAKGEEPYFGFLVKLTRAEEEAELHLVALIKKQAEGDWRAAAFLLERKHKERWGRQLNIEANVNANLDAELERRLLKGRALNAEGK